MRPLRFLLRLFCLLLGWLLLVILAVWAACAVWFDFPAAPLRHPLAVCLGIALLALLLVTRFRWRGRIGVLALVLLVAAWWFTLQPSNARTWQPNVAQTPWAEVNGDTVTLHNVRNTAYREQDDYTPVWETRSLRLSQLTGIDVVIGYWGSEWMAHPMLSFQFADAPPLAFSIETRKEVGESYSAIGGLYRQFELIYIAADERDVVRVRTNYDKGGADLYLYRTTLSREETRERFLEYLNSLNELRDHPKWYNAITTNCTTAIRTQHPGDRRAPFDWRMLVNGKLDTLLFDEGLLATDGLPFAELKQRTHVNAAAQTADKSPDFSTLIRAGRPGFSAARASEHTP